MRVYSEQQRPAYRDTDIREPAWDQHRRTVPGVDEGAFDPAHNVVCGSGPVLVLDPNANGGNGALVAQFVQLTSGDEVWGDPTTIRCFATGLTDPANAANTRVPGVIDFNGAVPNLIQLIATFNGDHSVAVDPISGEIFVPTGGAVAGSVCPLGCVLVFAQAAAVPEPASLTLMMTAFAGFAGLVWSRRRRQS